MAVVEEAVEPADPVPGPEQPRLPAGVPAGEPGGGAEGEPAEQRRERRLEEHGLGTGEAADGVDGEHRRQEVEALVPRRAHGAHLPVPPPAAGHRGAARGAVAAEVVVVPGVARAERGVVREHARRRAGRHGRGSVPPPLVDHQLPKLPRTAAGRRRIQLQLQPFLGSFTCLPACSTQQRQWEEELCYTVIICLLSIPQIRHMPLYQPF
jgi:hypothetical protein